MTVAIGNTQCVSADRFYGNQEVGLQMTASKLIVLPSNIVVAAAGDIKSLHYVYNNTTKLAKYDTNQLAKHLHSRSASFADAEYLVLDGTTIYEINQTSYAQTKVCAIGAGYQYALGAYTIGENTIDAVRAAIRWAPFCAGPIDTLIWDGYDWQGETVLE